VVPGSSPGGPTRTATKVSLTWNLYYFKNVV
jgi:hypothetical protein